MDTEDNPYQSHIFLLLEKWVPLAVYGDWIHILINCTGPKMHTIMRSLLFSFMFSKAVFVLKQNVGLYWDRPALSVVGFCYTRFWGWHPKNHSLSNSIVGSPLVFPWELTQSCLCIFHVLAWAYHQNPLSKSYTASHFFKITKNALIVFLHKGLSVISLSKCQHRIRNVFHWPTFHFTPLLLDKMENSKCGGKSYNWNRTNNKNK